MFLFLGFLRIKVIFHVCFRILSDFFQNWRFGPRVLSFFTDFLSWLSRIYTKKTPKGVENPSVLQTPYFSPKIGYGFQIPIPGRVLYCYLTSSRDLPLSGPHGKPISSNVTNINIFYSYRKLGKLQEESGLFRLFGLFGLSGLFGLFR